MKKNFCIRLSLTIGTLLIVAGCHSGQHIATRPQSAAVATTALPDQASQPAATKVAVSPAPSQSLPAVIRINAGGGAVKDATGVTWHEDAGFTGGDVIERPDLPIANTTQPEIYHSERYSMDNFTQKLPNGKYVVKLHFCETYEGISAPGERVFTFEVEGKVFKDFDVWVKAGGGSRAYVESVPVEIADGQLDIKFTPQVENPQINGIEIMPQP